MISLLIPTYNFTCYQLVYDLQQQLEAIGVSYEIIVADDGSKDQVSVIANLKINELKNCRYIRRMENIGRAAIRNLLVQESQGDWLLFLDSDAKVNNPNYMENFNKAMNEHPEMDILSGGLRHPATCPTPFCTLRYNYEKEADLHRGASERNLHPFEMFTTFNVAFRRKVFDQCHFDETCRQYGYEDTLFGFELKEAGFHLLHFDNPILHIGLESNEVYLRKIAISIQTLKSLGEKMKGRTRMQQMAAKLKRYHLTWLFRLLFAITRSQIQHNLLSQQPNLRMFAIYKLGLYLQS